MPTLPIAVLTAMLGVAGCDRAPTDAVNETREADLSFTQGPATPGQSPVFRFVRPGSAGWVILIDADTETAILSSGIDGIRAGDDIAELCPGETVEASNPLPFQVVTTRSGVQNVLGTGDLFSWAYDVRGLLPPGFPDAPLQDGPSLFFTCDFLTGDAMVAEGVLGSQQTVSSSPSGRTVVAAKGHGRLDDLVGGGETNANVKLNAVTNANGDLVRASVIVRLSPDPRFR